MSDILTYDNMQKLTKIEEKAAAKQLKLDKQAADKQAKKLKLDKQDADKQLKLDKQAADKQLKQLKQAAAKQAKIEEKAAIKQAKNDENALGNLIKEITNMFPKKIQTKIDNINKANVEGPLSTKRVSQDSRHSRPYDISHFPVSQLQTFGNGVVIRIPFRKYEEIRDNPMPNELDSYLLRNIGGNETVSCIICISKEDGYSGSGEQRIEHARFEIEAEKNGWVPVYRHKNIPYGEANKGNDKWSGHYYINISGGSQDCIRSHPDGELQIFTTYRGCVANEEVIIDVKLSLIWQLLHCFDITDIIPKEKLSSFLHKIECHLKTQIYMGSTCYELIEKLDTIREGILYSPINEERLSIHLFAVKKAIDISHNEAVCKQKMYFCETQNVLLSDYRPGNLFWDFHLANMQQQDFTIDEYCIDHERVSELRKQRKQRKLHNSSL